jgi:hypothetical protein
MRFRRISAKRARQAIQGFKKIQRHDSIKRHWARRNGYRLIVVSYRIKDIEGYLKKRLTVFGVAAKKKAA